MRIELKEDKDSKLILTTEMLDTYNFVDLIIEPEGDGIMVNLDELISAVEAFRVWREENLKRESYLS